MASCLAKLLVLVLCLWGRLAFGAALNEQVLIVYNEQEPESLPLARYYAERRNIPARLLCPINIRPAEVITRSEFENDVRWPILKFLRNHELITQLKGRAVDPVLGEVAQLETIGIELRYVVLVYGVPLKIEEDTLRVEPVIADQVPKPMRNNRASVESELALLPTTGAPISGPLINPFFEASADQFGPPWCYNMLLVGRLDGPDPATVRRLVDDALETERVGLHGRAYFDGRNISEEGYRIGDDWLKASAEIFRRLGYPTELDWREPTYAETEPLADAAVYAGWYATHANGPFAREDFRFRKGAVTCHIHSASGANVRSRTSFWVGPLIARGAAVTLGNVYEPFLRLTPHLDSFFQRLTNGSTFLEAAYHSIPGLSWQTTFVGDPLYRPFQLSLDEQIRVLEQEQHPDLPWAWLRKVNQLAQAGQPAAARDLCREKARQLDSQLLADRLAELQGAGEAPAVR